MNAITQNTKITSSDINTLISECNNKLSLSGGTLTGALYFGAVASMGISDNADYRTLWINRNSGNAIGIFDTDSPSNPGTILLRASNGSSSSDFWLYPNGKATLGGHSVITSVGGTIDKIHTSELEIKHNKLYFQGDVDTFITRNWDTTNGYYYLVMQAGTWGSCGRVEIYDNESPNETGAVALIAADKRFIVYPNGIARMTGQLEANYLYIHPQNNDKEGGELKLAASNTNLHNIICDNYNDNFRILFQNSSAAVPYIYNFSKDGRISTPTGELWIA